MIRTLKSWVNTQRGQLTAEQRLRLYTRLSRLLRGRRRGIAEALQLLIEQETVRGKLSPLAQRMDGWMSAIKAGKGESGVYGTLAYAMRDSVPRIEVAVLEAGEAADPVPALDGLIRMLTVERNLRRGIRRATVTPRLARLAIFIIILVIHYFLLPILAIGKPVSTWTGMPAVFAASVGFVATFWPVFLVMALLGPSLTKRIHDNWTGPQRRWADRYVTSFKLYRISQGAGVLFALAALIRAQLPEGRAIGVITNIVSPYTKSQLLPINAALHRGKAQSLGAAWRKERPDWPSTDIVLDLGTVEATREQSLSSQIDDVANESLRDIEANIKEYEVKAESRSLAFVAIAIVILMGGYLITALTNTPGVKIL